MTSQLTSHSFSRITRSHRFRSSFAAIMASCLALAGLSDVPASAQEGDFGAAAAGDPVTIEQVVLNDNGTYLAQNSAATSVLDSGDDPVEIVGLTINQNGAVEVLGDINLGPVTIQNLNIPTDESNYAVSENGQVTPRNSAQFSSALARNLVSPDLRDFQLAGDGNVSWGSDWDAMYGSPFSNDDYLVVAERHGNSSFELGALGEDGSLIAGSNRLVVPANYSWNTGFAPSDSSDQAMHISVYDIEAFGVDTAATQIFGFRYFSTGVADIKIWGASAEPFTEACPPGAPVNDIAAAQTGRWTRVNASTYRAPFGDTFVTATFGGSFEAQLAVMDQMDANDYSVSTVKNSDALDVVHNFPNNATVAFTFDDPVVDPSIHFARIGGYSGWGRVVWSHSSVVQLGGGLEWSETASNGPHFETTSTDLRRTIGALLDEHRRTGNMGAWNFGMAGGSTEITGTVTQIPLTFSAAGQAFDAGTGDSIEVVLTKPAVEGCGGVTDVDAVKSANAAVVVLEGEVEWSLHTTSTGTSEAENMVVIDSIPDALDAKSIRTGRWTPDGIRAKFSARVNGSWLTVANATGRTDATFSLPAGTDQVKVEYRDNLPTDFATTSPVTIVTDVISAASLSVQNCATWSADEMASKPRCQLIEVQELKAIPNLTAWNESQAAGPGEDISFKLRVENLNSAARPYVAPFLGVLLPDGLEFSTWAPISSGAAPAMTVVTNHNGTGRSLVRFDFGGTNIDPGDLYELRMITTVTGSAGAGVSEISFGTATNDNTHEIECAGTTAADIFDLDVDGVFAEELCSATATYEVEANFEVITAAHSKGNIGLPFINYDGEAGVEEVVVELEDIATGINTQTVGLPQIDTGLAADGSALGVGEDDPYWTRSDTRVSARTAARAVGKCNLSFP
ncbi:MAG: hypothetical protein GY925_22325, partial [Actinomycetia bacterium]|nr:hypothetical protein [Actinomycetes bacterium]